MTRPVAAEPPIALPVDRACLVLLVDDQVLVGEAIRRSLLNETDIAFHYNADPRTALATAKHLRPTVILQDLVMPGVDGLDLVRQYRADPELQFTPIIVLSSKDQPTIKSEAFRAGANDYLVKLPDQIELVARIRYHSNAYLAQVQRDEAYRALSESQKRLMAANLELQRLTNVDGLTGLCNKRHFSELIEAEWRRAIRDGTPLALLMIDVDHFKLYNDSYGHVAGDEALRQVATAIQAMLKRPGDVTARFGGEEFAVIMPQTDSRGATAVAEKVMAAVAALGVPHIASTTGAVLSVSVGGASVVPQPGESLFRLIDAADQALYDAKRRGRGLAVVHDQIQPIASKRPAYGVDGRAPTVANLGPTGLWMPT